jgi:PadR family transcriptional regulator PadR
MQRRTKALAQVAIAILATPDDRLWGYDLSKRSGVRSGVLYPMLTRMLADGWLTDGWEDPKTIKGGRPPRRYYKVTELGKGQLAVAQTVGEAQPVLGAKWGLAHG